MEAAEISEDDLSNDASEDLELMKETFLEDISHYDTNVTSAIDGTSPTQVTITFSLICGQSLLPTILKWNCLPLVHVFKIFEG